MQNKENVKSIIINLKISANQLRLIPKEELKEATKSMIANRFGKYIIENFTKLPVKYKELDNCIDGSRTISARLDIADSLVPITLKSSGKQIIAYVSADTAKELYPSMKIDSISLINKR